MKKSVGVQIEGSIYANNGEDLGNNQFLNALRSLNVVVGVLVEVVSR